MIAAHEDQAAGLRRLFRRAPPAVVALYAAGRNPPRTAVQAVYRIAGSAERVLVLDEADGEDALAGALDLPAGSDLLSVLGGRIAPGDLLQPVPGLIGRVPVAAAARALPMLDDERRLQLIEALRSLYRRAGIVLVHASCDGADDPSPFVHAAPRRLVVAEANRSGATQAYRLIKQLAGAGAGSVHVAVSQADGRAEASAFFASLDDLVRRHVGMPLVWLGEIERDDLAAGLTAEPASLPREAEFAFLRRLDALSRSGVPAGQGGAR